MFCVPRIRSPAEVADRMQGGRLRLSCREQTETKDDRQPEAPLAVQKSSRNRDCRLERIAAKYPDEFLLVPTWPECRGQQPLSTSPGRWDNVGHIGAETSIERLRFAPAMP